MMFFDIIDIEGILRTIFFWILKALLFLVKGLYNIFMTISRINVFDGDQFDIISGIYKRVQAILVIVMVFYLIFQFVQYILQPEVASDKNKGVEGSVKRIVVVVLLMAFTPTIFNFSYELKNRILHSQIIENIVMDNGSGLSVGDSDFNCNSPDSVAPGTCTDGGKFAARLLGLFVTAKRPNAMICEGETSAQERIFALQRELAGQTTWSHKWGCGLNDEIDDNGTFYVLNFEWLIAVPATLFIIWMFVLYCVEAGRMVFQFALLQLIAPVPIMSYLSSSKDNMFNKWVKQCVTTYIDVFIRLLIINFVLLLCSLIPDLPFGELSDNMFVKIFLILGLMLFALKAPGLIKELLPKGGGAAAGGFGIGKKSAAASALLGAGRGTAQALAKSYRKGANAARTLNRKRKLRKAMRDKGIGGRGLKGFHARGKVLRQRRRAEIRDDRDRAKKEYNDAINKEADALLKGDLLYRKEYQNLADKAKEANSRLKNTHASLVACNKEIEDLEKKGSLSESERTRYNNLTSKRDQLNSIYQKELVTAREANTAHVEAKKNLYKTSNDKKFETAASEFKEANKAYNSAEKAYNDIKNSSAYSEKEKNDAKIKMEQAKGFRDEKQKNFRIAQREIEGEAISKVHEAQDEYDRIKGMPDSPEKTDKLKEAKKNLNDAWSQFNTFNSNYFQKQRDKETKKDSSIELREAYEEAKKNTDTKLANYNIAKQEYKTSKNQEPSVLKNVGKVVGETLGIAKNLTYDNIKGAYQGAKDSDIAKVAEGYKKDAAEAIRREEFIAAGGDPTISGMIKSKVSNIASSYLGIPSSQEQFIVQNKSLELALKEEEASSKNQQAVPDAFDKFKGISDGILTKHKNHADMVGLVGMKFADKSDVKVTKGMSADQLAANYANETYLRDRTRQELAAEANKKEIELDNNGLGDTYRKIKDSIGGIDSKKTLDDFTNSEEFKKIKDIDKQNALIAQFSKEKAAYEAQEAFSKAEQEEAQVKKMIAEHTMMLAIREYAKTGDVSSLKDIGINDQEMAVGVTNFFTSLQTICADKRSADAVIEELKKNGKLTGQEISLLSKSTITISDLIGLELESFKNINDAIAISKVNSSNRIASYNERIRQNKEELERRQREEQFYNGGNGSSGGK